PRTTGPSGSVLSHLRHRRCLMGMTTTHLPSTDASHDRDEARRAIRVPLKTPSGILGRIVTWYSRRAFGDVPDPAYVMSHHPGVLRATLSYEGKVATWDALDADLKNLVQLASAASIGCSWCMDFGYFAAHSKGQSVEKFAEVPRWRQSDVFTPLERDVIADAEAMNATPPRGT